MFSSKITNVAGRCRTSALLAVSLLAVPACFAQFTAPAPTSNAEIAWFTMGRMGVNPVNGNVLPYGFFTIVNGLPFPIFTGLPNESTALFTFRYTVSQILPLTSNLDQNIYIGAPALIDIYLNPNAKRDWNDPNTFATGQKIATYIRGAYQSEQIFVTQYQMSSAKLISSTPFSFGGQSFDFGKLAPSLTIGDYVGVIPGGSLGTQFPLVYATSSYGVVNNAATPAPAANVTTSAVAGPRNVTVGSPEFQLDGSKSTSPDGAALKYEWTLASGSPEATILEGNTATPRVRFGATPGTYTFQLRVTDRDGNSSADFATVNFAGN